ncbi:MAG: patatin-like phospholipase family protein [Opitutaceae bacterium]
MPPLPFDADASASAFGTDEAGRSGHALCLSGGGYRAALFHLGALRRLNECGLLGHLDMISSVSGGSILAAHLARVVSPWPAADGIFPDWETQVAAPFRAFCRCDIRTPAVLRSLRNPWRLLRHGLDPSGLEIAYARLLTPASLAGLPDTPRFVFCATELLTATLWRFERDAIRSWRTTNLKPEAGDTVARAVAASSCFPPLFAPMRPTREEDRIPDLVMEGRNPLPASQLQLTDGGLYDNLGIEPAIKRHKVLFISDGGAPFDYAYSDGLVRQGARYAAVLARQVANLRWQEFFHLRGRNEILGGYWKLTHAQPKEDGTPSDGADGRYSEKFASEIIASIRTDLNTFTPVEAGVLENHGYWQADGTIKLNMIALAVHSIPDPVCPHPELTNEPMLRNALRDRARRLPRNPFSALRTLWRGRKLPARLW